MTRVMRNFSRVEETLVPTVTFYARVAVICEDTAERIEDPRERWFMEHAAECTGELARCLRRPLAARRDRALNAWVQYTPDEPLPGAPELGALAACIRAQDVLAEIQRATLRWQTIHGRFQQSLSTEAARGYHASFRALLDAWSRSLAAAYQQQGDL